MSLLLTIDPGKRHCGCALWQDGKLAYAKLVEANVGTDDLPSVAFRMANAVLEWANSKTNSFFMHIVGAQLVCEYPQTYKGRAGKGDANDLIDLAVVVGAIQGTLDVPTTLVRPSEWKGSVPKPELKRDYVRDGYIIETRARAALTTDENTRVTWTPKNWRTNMDIADAIGVGLVHLKRRRVGLAK